MSATEKIKEEIKNSIATKERMLGDRELLGAIEKAACEAAACLKGGGKILVCGNGGSASDALHIAGELVGRFQRERKAFRAIALNSDVALMTAIANDYGYDRVFSRQVEGLMSPGDILIGISTSGNSANVVKAFEKAAEKGGKTILLSGADGGKLKSLSDISILIPSRVTARIQEAHECVYHILCGLIEDFMCDE